jgi:hypothetical protein
MKNKIPKSGKSHSGNEVKIIVPDNSSSSGSHPEEPHGR